MMRPWETLSVLVHPGTLRFHTSLPVLALRPRARVAEHPLRLQTLDVRRSDAVLVDLIATVAQIPTILTPLSSGAGRRSASRRRRRERDADRKRDKRCWHTTATMAAPQRTARRSPATTALPCAVHDGHISCSVAPQGWRSTRLPGADASRVVKTSRSAWMNSVWLISPSPSWSML
jgi:hypothetical protein